MQVPLIISQSSFYYLGLNLLVNALRNIQHGREKTRHKYTMLHGYRSIVAAIEVNAAQFSLIYSYCSGTTQAHSIS